MTINKFPGRRQSKINKPSTQRDGGINNQKTPGRRSEPRVAGEPPTKPYSALTFQSNFGDGRHGKQGTPKSTTHGYSRAAHHHDYLKDRGK